MTPEQRERLAHESVWLRERIAFLETALAERDAARKMVLYERDLGDKWMADAEQAEATIRRLELRVCEMTDAGRLYAAGEISAGKLAEVLGVEDVAAFRMTANADDAQREADIEALRLSHDAYVAEARRLREALEAARQQIANMPTREEWIGGQRAWYVQVSEVLFILDAALAGTEES